MRTIRASLLPQALGLSLVVILALVGLIVFTVRFGGLGRLREVLGGATAAVRGRPARSDG